MNSSYICLFSFWVFRVFCIFSYENQFVFAFFGVFCLICFEFNCQFWYKWLPEKTDVRNDLLCTCTLCALCQLCAIIIIRPRVQLQTTFASRCFSIAVPQSGTHSHLAFALVCHHTHSMVFFRPTVSSGLSPSGSLKCRSSFWLTLHTIKDFIYLVS